MVKEIIGIDVILSHTDFAVFKSIDVYKRQKWNRV